MRDLREVGLGDTVHHPRFGGGEVVRVTEQPSVQVKFDRKLVTFTNRNCEKLEVV
jgi:hypothetical protein